MYRVVRIDAADWEPFKEAAKRSFRNKRWTRARRELEPEAEVDAHAYLKITLPSVTVDEGDILYLVRKILDRFDDGFLTLL